MAAIAADMRQRVRDVLNVDELGPGMVDREPEATVGLEPVVRVARVGAGDNRHSGVQGTAHRRTVRIGTTFAPPSACGLTAGPRDRAPMATRTPATMFIACAMSAAS